MSTENITCIGDCLTQIPFGQLFSSSFVPITLGVLGFIGADRYNEWKKRRMDSRLGAAIMETLLEEVNQGIKIMEAFVSNKTVTPSMLPTQSWSGMSSIPNEVLIRIIESSNKNKYDSFNPKDCRSHCKNYFEYMCSNYNALTSNLLKLGDDNRSANQRNETSTQLLSLFGDQTNYLDSSKKIRKMLENTITILIENSKKWFPY